MANLSVEIGLSSNELENQFSIGFRSIFLIFQIFDQTSPWP
jgi:hypothetical protein